MSRPPVPEWIAWGDLAALLGKSVKQVRRDAQAARVRLFCPGVRARGVLRVDVPRLYTVRGHL